MIHCANPAAMCLDDCPADIVGQPVPGLSDSGRPRNEHVEKFIARQRRETRAVVLDRDFYDLPLRLALSSMGVLPGAYLAAFSSRLQNTRSIKAASNSSRGNSWGRSTSPDVWPVRCRAA